LFPASFDYTRPASLTEAIELLDGNSDYLVLAGGQSLIPALKSRRKTLVGVVDIGRISELHGIRRVGERLRFGSLETYSSVVGDASVSESQAVIRETVNQIADPQVRNIGTLGGSLCWADPTYDLPTLMLVLEASLVVAGARGSRRVEAADFFVNPFETSLGRGEILTSIEVPVRLAGEGYAYHKLSRGSGGFSLVGVAAYVKLAGDGTASVCRLAITAPPGKAYRATDAEQSLVGTQLNHTSIGRASKLASDGLGCIDSSKTTWSYAHTVLLRLVQAALMTAIHKAEAEP
jgi:carbon-monoxide dehydrogenase medium subunit